MSELTEDYIQESLERWNSAIELAISRCKTYGDIYNTRDIFVSLQMQDSIIYITTSECKPKTWDRLIQITSRTGDINAAIVEIKDHQSNPLPDSTFPLSDVKG